MLLENFYRILELADFCLEISFGEEVTGGAWRRKLVRIRSVENAGDVPCEVEFECGFRLLFGLDLRFKRCDGDIFKL